MDINEIKIDEILDSNLPDLDLEKYYRLEGILCLTLIPFCQGLFHGLGEAVGKALFVKIVNQ